jgi:hypothetical protein
MAESPNARVTPEWIERTLGKLRRAGLLRAGAYEVLHDKAGVPTRVKVNISLDEETAAGILT